LTIFSCFLILLIYSIVIFLSGYIAGTMQVGNIKRNVLKPATPSPNHEQIMKSIQKRIGKYKTVVYDGKNYKIKHNGKYLKIQEKI